LAQAKSFDLYTCEEIALAVGDMVRITKNFRAGAQRFRINELCAVKAVDDETIIFEDNRMINLQTPLHLDHGIAVTSHAAQGKTVDQVLVSGPVAAFSQINQAQFYVSMSRARSSMHLFTDSKVALIWEPW
jgi:ATP-dependent exoDNAse (exonuclease V) alpha subunit